MKSRRYSPILLASQKIYNTSSTQRSTRHGRRPDLLLELCTLEGAVAALHQLGRPAAVLQVTLSKNLRAARQRHQPRVGIVAKTLETNRTRESRKLVLVLRLPLRHPAQLIPQRKQEEWSQPKQKEWRHQQRTRTLRLVSWTLCTSRNNRKV